MTKVVVTVVGGLVMLAGVVMLFTPGQGILAIVLGLAILATEYAWAERWLRKAREKAAEAKRRAEGMDPAVRRRRLLIAGVLVLVVVVARRGLPRHLRLAERGGGRVGLGAEPRRLGARAARDVSPGAGMR